MHKATRNMWVAAFLFWAPVITFLAIADEVVEKEPIGIDSYVLNTLHHLATPTLDRLVIFLTHLGGMGFLLPTTLLIIFALYFTKHLLEAKLVALIVGGAGIVNVLLKMLFQRNRPALWESIVTEHSYSFPSGHAMASSALAFALVAVYWRTRWRWWAIVLGACYIMTIGLTRVYLGVHFPSDIVAGWCVSLAWALVVYKVLHRKKPETSTPSSHV